MTLCGTRGHTNACIPLSSNCHFHVPIGLYAHALYRTVTRTDYEVDFIDAFTKIAGLAAFDPDAYLVDREPVDLSKLKL